MPRIDAAGHAPPHEYFGEWEAPYFDEWDTSSKYSQVTAQLPTSLLLATTLTLLPLTATSNASGDAPPADIQVMRDGSGTGGFVSPAPGEEPSLAAQRIVRLHIQSGLTWNELARAFGTTRRTLHNWAIGRRIGAKHVDTFRDLSLLISAHYTGNAAQTRATLITPRPDGESPLSEFLASHRRVPERPEGFSPQQLV
jgi:hypothetical protein